MNFKEALFLNKMITPAIITFLYWVGLVAVILGGLYSMATQSFIGGLISIPVGLIFVRLWSELIILAFKMYDCMKKIADNVGSIQSTTNLDK